MRDRKKSFVYCCRLILGHLACGIRILWKYYETYSEKDITSKYCGNVCRLIPGHLACGIRSIVWSDGAPNVTAAPVHHQGKGLVVLGRMEKLNKRFDWKGHLSKTFKKKYCFQCSFLVRQFCFYFIAPTEYFSMSVLSLNSTIDLTLSFIKKMDKSFKSTVII